MKNKDDERLRKTTIAFLKDFAEKGYENAVECIDWLEKLGEQKSEWSEEDEKYLKLAIENFQTLGNSFLTSWLKSIKDKVQAVQTAYDSFPEEPVSEDLEKEMDSYFNTMQVLEHENIFEITFQKIAKHFFELGLNASNQPAKTPV